MNGKPSTHRSSKNTSTPEEARIERKRLADNRGRRRGATDNQLDACAFVQYDPGAGRLDAPCLRD